MHYYLIVVGYLPLNFLEYYSEEGDFENFELNFEIGIDLFLIRLGLNFPSKVDLFEIGHFLDLVLDLCFPFLGYLNLI